MEIINCQTEFCVQIKTTDRAQLGDDCNSYILIPFFLVGVESAFLLCEEDFRVALEGFSPAALRNVPLHQAGTSDWSSVGGLKEVRNVLVQTLQWPAKVTHKLIIWPWFLCFSYTLDSLVRWAVIV